MLGYHTQTRILGAITAKVNEIVPRRGPLVCGPINYPNSFSQ
jgi:hypothetical protein